MDKVQFPKNSQKIFKKNSEMASTFWVDLEVVSGSLLGVEYDGYRPLILSSVDFEIFNFFKIWTRSSKNIGPVQQKKGKNGPRPANRLWTCPALIEAWNWASKAV